MNFKHLEALIYVSRCGTFRQAAEALFFDSAGDEFNTPETIQYRVKQLEKDLGITLYRKRQGSPRVTLTREGQLFLPEALDTYQRMLTWRGRFNHSDLNDPLSGWLTIAATQALLLHRLLAPVVTFRKANPDVRFRLMDSDTNLIEHLVEEGRVDFGFSTRLPERPELEYVLWRRSDLVLVVRADHPLASKQKSGVSLKDVAEYSLVVLHPQLRSDREALDETFRQLGVRRLKIAVETSNSELIKAYVAAGLGVGIVAEVSVSTAGGTTTPQKREPGFLPLVGTSDPNGRLVAVKIHELTTRTEAGLLVREGQFVSSAGRAFLQSLDPVFETWLAERFPAPEPTNFGFENQKSASNSTARVPRGTTPSKDHR